MAAVSATTLAWVSLATTVVGAGVSVYGQEQQRKTVKRTAEFNAKIKENQAIEKDMELRENIRRKRKRNRRVLATQRAQIGASGVHFEGSPLEALADNAATLELEVFDLARAGESQRRSLLMQAQGIREEGRAAASALRINQATTLLNSGADVAGKYATFKKQGLFDGD